MADKSFLNWPFFEERHRELAERLEAWCAKNLPVEEGVLARRADDGVLTDKPWMPTAISVAQKYAAPVVPVHVAGPWATLFH